MVESRWGQWGGGAGLARLGLLRPPADRLSSVPRSICFCSNFIPLMEPQLGTCSPHPCPMLWPAPASPSQPQRTPKGSVRGTVRLPSLPRMNFEMDGSVQGGGSKQHNTKS